MYISSKCIKCNQTLHPKLQQAQHQLNYENHNPWQYRYIKDKCCFFSPFYQNTCACLRLAPNLTTASAAKTGVQAEHRQYMHRQSHQNMTGLGKNYVLSPVSVETHLSVSSAQPRVINQQNGKLKCHQVIPVMRQRAFTNGHVHSLEENVDKCSYMGEILFNWYW